MNDIATPGDRAVTETEEICFNCKHMIFKIWFKKAFNGMDSQGYCEVDDTPVNIQCTCEDFSKGKNAIYEAVE